MLVFEDRMQPATAANAARALAWLEELGLEFETNVYDALDLSFLLAGRGARDRYYPAEVDTMFFLSDGEPTRPGENGRLPPGDAFGDPQHILAAVRRWNALSRVRIHTIGIGLQGGGARGRRGARTLLRELAAQNGGAFVQRR